MSDTPLMKQYHDFKQQYADKILFFRLGDFYEMFDEDAIEVSSLLNLTLTHKGDSPMCGIPYHAAKNYIKRLLDEGKKIVICEQMELADSSKSLAKREVVRIITPATVVDEDFVDNKNFNYLFSVFQSYCSYCDITTGDFVMRNLNRNDRVQDLRQVLQQISPNEILVCEDEYYLDSDFKQAIDLYPCMITKLAPWYFNQKKGFELLCNHLQVKSLSAFGINENDKLCSSSGALLKYLLETSKSPVKQINTYRIEEQNSYLAMDESSRKNLELFKNLNDGSSKFSLCETINRCKTYSGFRLLKQYLSFPLCDIEQIKFRQKWVKFFVENTSELERVRNSINSSSDLNRLATRILMKRGTPHDLVGIKQSIGIFFNLISADPEKYRLLFDTEINSVNLENVSELMNVIQKSVNPDFLGQYNPGQVIMSGYDEELDNLRMMKDESDKLLKDYLEKEKIKTGISILKIGYNKIFGYYLEVPKGQIIKCPDYFYRKQTLVNGERFTTDELMNFEKDILSSEARAQEREQYIYDCICNKVIDNINTLNSIGDFISKLDVYQSFATLAMDSDYVCPEICEDDYLYIKDGRHPVVEKQVGKVNYVPNNLDMNVRFSLITGPNMAGKSTYLRQNALIILLAHIGSFVPASEAKIPVTDKIFCRVGASDNLARGESTFLVEMQETAYILRNCTNRSFVIVDEIGRGTSTQDGMSIAYAVMRNLISINCKTLFATHYHELTMLDNSNVHLQTLSVEENNGKIVFLRKVVDGVANSSYGIHVAQMAGIPNPVIREAKTFQNRHFADYNMQQNSLFTSEDATSFPEAVVDSNTNEVIEELVQLNIDECTPMQAMIILSKLKEKLH